MKYLYEMRSCVINRFLNDWYNAVYLSTSYLTCKRFPQKSLNRMMRQRLITVPLVFFFTPYLYSTFRHLSHYIFRTGPRWWNLSYIGLTPQKFITVILYLFLLTLSSKWTFLWVDFDEALVNTHVKMSPLYFHIFIFMVVPYCGLHATF